MNQTLRILYAEDNHQDADLTRNHFQHFAPEFEIEIVDTGQSCLERLRTEKFDLLLLDHRLPDMDGSAVLSALVRSGVQLPVVLVTGSGNEDLVVKVLRLGAASYLPKLGNYLETLPDILRSVIKEHLRKQNQGEYDNLPVRILYVENSMMDAELTLQYFAEAAPNFVVDVAASSAQALLRLGQAEKYDLALIDLGLPDQSGLDLVRELRRLGLLLPPFIVISGRGDDAAVIAALQLGAINYIAKREGYLQQLVVTIDQVAARHRLNQVNRQLQTELAERKRIETVLRESETHLYEAVNELRQREETILNLATHDELTGLPNRRLFYDRLEMALSEARRYGRKVAVLFIDLDHFKNINDMLGHQAGDQFLNAVVAKIKAVPREMDTLARLGGDEFALILSSVESADQVGIVAWRILDSLHSEFMIDNTPLHASASIGVALFPDDAEDVSLLLKHADIAMYQAKEAGRNTCRFWSNPIANPAAVTIKAQP